jgi:uncharacterized protein (UPF0147 family)
MDKTALIQVIEALRELQEDHTVPKNVKAKIEFMIGLLSEDCEDCIKIDKALHEMETITEDCNMQPYTRTQIFNVVSLLEMVK